MNLHAPSLKLTSNKLDDFSQVRICHKKTNFTRVKQVPDIICGLGSRRSHYSCLLSSPGRLFKRGVGSFQEQRLSIELTFHVKDVQGCQ